MFPVDNLDLTIDSVYKQLLEVIQNDGRTIQVSKELLSKTENHQRVFYVYDLLKHYNIIPIIVKEDKSEYASLYYREVGNTYFKRPDLYLAWQYYNLALMYSPLLAPSYCLAIANRSAVLAALKEYKACLEDIKMVFSLQYPDSIRDKLLKRKKQCEEALQRAEDPGVDDEKELIDDIFTFKSPKHEKYVDASSKLSVNYSPEMGRHVVANEDIEVGEIIVQEDPFVRLLLRSQITIACSHCFSRNFNLYPCPYCCMTMYCSRPCVEQAWAEYHSFECPLIASLIKSNFTKLELIALRTTVRARTLHKEWDNVFEMVSEAEACTNADDLGCKLTENGNLVYASKNYASVHTLATNIEKRDMSDIFQKAVSAAILMHYLAVANFVKTDDRVLKEKMKRFTAVTLMRHLMTAPTNMHGIDTNVENLDGNYVDEYSIACGAYPFLSLINHSCAPNVVRCNRLDSAQITLFALRPIKKGMQIFDNYGAHHAVHSREERHATLRFQYKFTCICEACTDDWPLYFGLNPVRNLPVAIANKKNEYLNGNVIEALQKADKKRALKLFKPLCELATALEPYIPCKEASECQEAVKQCLAILSGVLPNGYTHVIDFDIPAPKPLREPTSAKFYLGQGAFGLNK